MRRVRSVSANAAEHRAGLAQAAVDGFDQPIDAAGRAC